MIQNLKNFGNILSSMVSECRGRQSTAATSEENGTPESLFTSLAQKLRELRLATGRRADRLAILIAEQMTDWTGKEFTADAVKKGARNGVVIGTLAAMLLMQRSAATRTNHSTSADCPTDSRPGNDFSGSHRTNYADAARCQVNHDQDEQDEQWLESIRLEQEHLDHLVVDDQQNYFDATQQHVDEQNMYFENFDD